MEGLLTQVDSKVNKAILEDSGQEGVRVDIRDAEAAHAEVAKMVKQVFGEEGLHDAIKQGQSSGKKENEKAFMGKVALLGEVGSNCAHMMQELGGKWIHSHPEN